ncbi:phage recombination protein Bet [Candidatus Pacearchaeota archaeon]|jgi:phage recombination protein Bet|nr:phage recombination protein Bet [Candidatus Pacearchaeota archaeon]
MNSLEQQFLSDEEYGLLRREKCNTFTDDQFATFRYAIERFQLDPFANQIYAVIRSVKINEGYEKKLTIQTGIDGFRLIADRSGKYAGNDDPSFDRKIDPNIATVSVYKIVAGLRCPFTASARWDQYFPGEKQGKMWLKMPHLMLGKCAEALALRKAFPAELSGLYTTEEMAQADKATELSPGPPQHRKTPNENGKRTGETGSQDLGEFFEESLGDDTAHDAALRTIDEAIKNPATTSRQFCALCDRVESSEELPADCKPELYDLLIEAMDKQLRANVGKLTYLSIPKTEAMVKKYWSGPMKIEALTLLESQRKAVAAC